MDDLSLTGKHWRLKPHTTPLRSITDLLNARGIQVDPPTLVPPSVFPDMERAVSRIRQAIETNERIGIFGDYDCDGVTAVAQLVRFFRRQQTDPWVRLPHRVRDGYGLKAPIVQEIVNANVNLLITADTGITAVDEIATLQQNGIDVIVTDHHQTKAELPLAYALIHPALTKHPLPHPSGSGVVYKLIHALEDGTWEDMASDTALAMLGTVADLVELRGENRALTQLGLRSLEQVTGVPLAELRERCKSKQQPLSSVDVAFRAAPRINAAGRMADADLALKALLEGGDALAQLDLLNEQRQKLSRELCARAEREFDTGDIPPVLISVSSDYPHGIVGLIAGKLTEKFGRPSLVAHTDGHMCTASLRSPDTYNIALGLGTCDDLLEHYGGHAQAAGCSFALQNVEAISQRLTDDVLSHVPASQLVPTVDIDMELHTEDITVALCNTLHELEPYGQGNAEPRFVLRHVSLRDTRACGQDGAHLTGRINGKKCVGFTLGHFAGGHDFVDVVVRIELQEWNGKTEPQLIIEDIASAQKKVREAAPISL